MSKLFLLVLTLAVIILTSLVVFLSSDQSFEYKPGVSDEFDAAVNQAKYIYKLRKEAGEDFSLGPCLTNALMPGWVVDIVHNPRQKIDDLPENQCPAFLEGKAKHFVELDTEGSFVRAR